MEIIHLVLGKANPNETNGLSKVVYELATHQTFAGKKVSVWGFSSNLSKDEVYRPFKLQTFKFCANSFRLDSKFKAAMQSKKGEVVVHIHGSWVPIFYSAILLLKKLNIPTILTSYGGYNDEALKGSGWWKRIYFNLFENQLLKYSTTIQCISNAELLGLEKLGYNEKAISLHYGYYIKEFPVAKKKHETFTFCYHGKMEIYNKGLDLLLNAFERVHQQFKDVELLMIGSGTDFENLLQLTVEKGLVKEISFSEHSSEMEKMELIGKSHVFVQPSRIETFPLEIFEAASVSLPIIASKTTNFGGVIQRNRAGWAIENNNENSLYEAMLHSVTMTSEHLTTRGQNARLMLEKEYNWETILTRYDAMYENAFQEKSGFQQVGNIQSFT
ncbi:MAG: glycosyltransferase [Crocinitomicaceae bacterium]